MLALGGCPSAEIAQRLARDEATIRRWEALFFDVRHGLEATGWIRWHVVAPEERRGDYARAARFKAAAAGGRAMARALLDLESRAPRGPRSRRAKSCSCANSLSSCGWTR
jgi:hypothetical protein